MNRFRMSLNFGEADQDIVEFLQTVGCKQDAVRCGLRLFMQLLDRGKEVKVDGFESDRKADQQDAKVLPFEAASNNGA